MASEARPSNGADSHDPLDRHASLAMTEAELFTRKRYHVIPPSGPPRVVASAFVPTRGKTRENYRDHAPVHSPQRCVAFNPLPVRTTIVVWSARMMPDFSRRDSAAAATAEVGSA
jgi:hypothetical protein